MDNVEYQNGLAPASAVVMAAPDTALQRRLLIVDDDTVHQMVISRIAEKIGYVAVKASSFEQARAILGCETFHCITLDLSLGQIGGGEVLRVLSQLGLNCPVLIISGSDRETFDATEALGRSLGLNIHRAIHKPVDLAELRETLAALV